MMKNIFPREETFVMVLDAGESFTKNARSPWKSNYLTELAMVRPKQRWLDPPLERAKSITALVRREERIF